MENEKEYLNKDLYGLSEEQFDKTLTNDFIGDDFIEQLEWAMLMVQTKFKQIKLGNHIPTITANHFDKSYLLSSGIEEMKDNLKFFAPFTDLQVTPEIFPNLNIKYMLIENTIQLNKVKQIDKKTQHQLSSKKQYAYQLSHAFFNKETESFYATSKGYEFNKGFFSLLEKDKEINMSDLPHPMSLHPNYIISKDAFKFMTIPEIVDISKIIAMAYQVAMSMYYEWCIYIAEYDNIGFIIPINPQTLAEIYKTSLLKFDSKKRMLHFVRDHYRRKVALPEYDYSIYVKKYLRGEHRFDFRSFHAEIIPPRYDLNRVVTKKKFININD